MIEQPAEIETREEALPEDEPPPFLGSWKNVYLLLVGELLVLTALFYALTRWAS
jgi:hypothetical protein